MTIKIELRPEEERALLEGARVSGRDLASYIHHILHEHLRTRKPATGLGETGGRASKSVEDLIDDEAIATSEKEADESVSLEEVRAATSKIKDSMARVVIEEERAERF
jgi:hypothetical protein